MLEIADRELNELGFEFSAKSNYSVIYVKKLEDIELWVEIFLTGINSMCAYSMPGHMPACLTAREVATFYRKMRELGLRYEG